MPRYWFRQKSFGYGATPVTWEGWVMTVLGILLVVAVVHVAPHIRDNGLRLIWVIGGSAVVALPFSYIAWRKTEGGWRWRS